MMRFIHEVMLLCASLTEVLARYKSVLRNIFRQPGCSEIHNSEVAQKRCERNETCWNKKG